jgi:hypothetical protein
LREVIGGIFTHWSTRNFVLMDGKDTTVEQ